LSSYNYLGFAENTGPVIDEVEGAIKKYGLAAGSPRMDCGLYDVTTELERLIARFVGKPAALVFGMGYATNSTSIPALGGKGALIISDSLNHASIVCGCKDSGATIRVFKHNNVEDLEKLLRNAIIEGQPRTRRPWKKIWIVVEGVYSMEGEIVNLRPIIEVKKKYKAYLYVDEAHSIGALGKTGRGVCEHWGVNPDDVDILMGTFTKAFGSVGGYISGSENFIQWLRHNSYGPIHATAMSPACAKMALSSLKFIMGEDGSNDGQRRIKQLHENSNFFRKCLKELGFEVLGDHDSPVVPVMLYSPTIMAYASRELLKRGVAAVIVGFPVTPLLLSRIRFCLSAAHTRDDLEFALKHINVIGENACIKYTQ